MVILSIVGGKVGYLRCGVYLSNFSLKIYQLSLFCHETKFEYGVLYLTTLGFGEE